MFVTYWSYQNTSNNKKPYQQLYLHNQNRRLYVKKNFVKTSKLLKSFDLPNIIQKRLFISILRVFS